MAVRRVAVAAWLAALALCVLQISHTRFVTDLSSFLPSSPTAEQRFLIDQLRDGAVARVMLIGIDGGEAATRATLSRSLAATLRSDAAFLSVSNGAASGFERERDFVFAHRYALSPRVSPRRFTVQGLRDAVSETVDLLASPAGLLMKPLVVRDPTGETLAALEQLRPPEGPRLLQGVWATPSGDRALLLAQTRAGAADIDGQARAAATVERAFGAAVAKAGPSAATARLAMTGPGVFSARSRALIEHEVVRLTTVSALLVVTLLLLVYRSPVALGLGLVPVATGALAGIAAVSLGFGAVHGITLGFGTTLIGEAVDYSIYFFVQAERGAQAGEREWLASFWPTIRLGVLTSIAGFCALAFSSLPGLEQLGVYSIAGLAAAAAVTRFVLPALLPRGFRIRDLSSFGAHLEDASVRATRWRAAVAGAALLACVVLAAKRDTLWDSELASLNPISASDRALDAELRAALGASDARYVVAVRTASAEAALEAAEGVGARLDPLAEAGRLGGYDSPARILPSEGTQRARLASIPDEAALRARLAEALAPLPLRPAKLEAFVADAVRAKAAAPITRSDIAGTALEGALAGLLFADASGQWTAVVSLRPAPGAAIDAAAVRDALAGSGATFLDIKAQVDRLYSGYFDAALAASAGGLLAIVALLFAALRRPARVLRVMAPLVAGVAVIAAAHALAGTRLTLMHLVGLLLVVAIGSNYALFFDRMAERRDPNRLRTLASLALANATSVASFGALSISQIPVLKAIGTTVAPGVLLTLAFTAALCTRYNRAEGD